MKSIVLIIDHFAERWPEWFPLFLQSCSRNPTIDWIIHTDCPIEGYACANIRFSHMTWSQYQAHVSRKLKISFDAANRYKICDLRAAYGVIWEDEIAGYDFFGWGDLDVIYGDLRHFLTDAVLANSVVSTHNWCFSGHFCLLKNQRWARHAFRRLPNWRVAMESHESFRFDEDHLIRAFLPPDEHPPTGRTYVRQFADRINPFRAKYRRLYLVEQYTTPLVPGLWEGSTARHSHVWYWKEGRVTNEGNGDRQFMYLHLMNYVSARWMDESYGEFAPWSRIEKLLEFEPARAGRGFRIDLKGFSLIES